MSLETSEWLNRNVLVGYTDQRNHAWHYKASDQGDEPNHYAGPIPVADVVRRLFNFQAVEVPLWIPVPCSLEEATGVDPDSGQPIKWKKSVQGRKIVVANDNYDDLGVFKDGYDGHDYEEWLIENFGHIVGGDLNIASAALLRNRAVAFVSIEAADSVDTPQGVAFRPCIFGTTSFNGTVATTYGASTTFPICDNTVELAKGEAAAAGRRVKVRHTRNSSARVSDVREALGILARQTESTAASIEVLCNTKVTPAQWRKVLDALVPLTDASGEAKIKKSLTIAENKRAALEKLYSSDDRVAPWAKTAFGVFQCVSTFNQHEGTIRNTNRVERNLLDQISGAAAADDARTIEVLSSVCGTIDLPLLSAVVPA